MATTTTTHTPDQPASQPAPPLPSATQVALRYERSDAQGVGCIVIDVPGQKVNTLSVALMPKFETVFEEARKDPNLRALILTSGKAAGFIAGADIGDLNGVASADDGARLSRQGQQAMDRIASFGVPTVAAIHGDCLGGGLELALACTARILSTDPKTKLGLPEVQLGLLPGAGGTVRLPELIGLTAALDMMLTGKNIRPDKAVKMGLADMAVPHGQLMAAARQLAADLAAGKGPKEKKQDMQAEVQELLLERNALGRMVVLREARKKVMQQSKMM